MLDYKHILYAVDIKDNFLPKLEKLISNSRSSGAKLTIAYFLKSFTAEYSAMAAVYVAFDNLQAKLVDHAREELTNLLSKFEADQLDIIVEETDNIKTAIIDNAEDLNVDAIYVNGNEHNLIGRLGSVADYVINNAKCDVVVLKK